MKHSSTLVKFKKSILLAFVLCLLLQEKAFSQDVGPFGLELPALIIAWIVLLIVAFVISFMALYSVLMKRRQYPADAKLMGWVFYMFFLLCVFPPLLLWGVFPFVLFIILWALWLIFMIAVVIVMRRQRRY